MPDDVSLPTRASNRDLQTMSFEEALEVYTPSLVDALPDHIPPQRFKRVLLTAVNLNPDLAHADRRSLFNSCVKCAHDGLYPDGREAALVVYNTRVQRTNERGMQEWVSVPMCQYLPMVAGIRKRMRNSGEVIAAIAEVVYSHDKFHQIKGIDGRIEHEPPPLDEDRGVPIGAYAQIKLRTGEVIPEVMTKADILKIRDTFSRGAFNKDGTLNAKSPWATSESEMWRKTVLRRCAKSAPSDSDLDRVLNRDDEPLDEPHPAMLPPPRPTRAQFDDDYTSADRHADDRANALPDPAESEAHPERKEEPHRTEPQTQADPPQETETPRLRRPRATKAEMAARKAAEAQPRSAAANTAEFDSADAGSSPAASPSYAIINPEGEIHDFGNTIDATNFLGGLFAHARGQRSALEALREDNQDFMSALAMDDLTAYGMLSEAYESELAASEPTTAKPGIGGASEMADRQGPAAAESTEPLQSAGPPASYAIEPVYEKNRNVARAWFEVLLKGKVRNSHNRLEGELWLEANRDTLQAYKNTLTPAGAIAAAKEIDDIIKGFEHA